MGRHQVCSLESKSLNVNVSCKKSLTAKQVDYVYNNCQNGEMIGTKQMYECERKKKEKK